MSCLSPLLLINLKGLRVEQSRICRNFHVSIGDVEVGVSLGFFSNHFCGLDMLPS